jgi:hypothetical protein
MPSPSDNNATAVKPGEVLGGDLNRKVRQEARQSEDAVTPPDGLDGFLRHLIEFLAVDCQELVRERAREGAVQAQADGGRSRRRQLRHVYR